jgi:PBP1b-binding outer membrane lipoprotein LpoB
MKKILAIVVVAMFGFTFGCGATPPAVETPAAPEAPAVETPDVPEAPAVDAPADPAAPEAPAVP